MSVRSAASSHSSDPSEASRNSRMNSTVSPRSHSGPFMSMTVHASTRTGRTRRACSTMTPLYRRPDPGQVPQGGIGVADQPTAPDPAATCPDRPHQRHTAPVDTASRNCTDVFHQVTAFRQHTRKYLFRIGCCAQKYLVWSTTQSGACATEHNLKPIGGKVTLASGSHHNPRRGT